MAAGHILAKGPAVVRLAKLVVRRSADADQRTGRVVERLAQALLYTSDDKRKAPRRSSPSVAPRSRTGS